MIICNVIIRCHSLVSSIIALSLSHTYTFELLLLKDPVFVSFATTFHDSFYTQGSHI